MKILPRIDPSRPYLKEAAKFIRKEKVDQEKVPGTNNIALIFWLLQTMWPTVKSEIMLMDFLFTSKNRVKESEALLIIVLLLDLQEDYRHQVKRSVLRYILK